VFEDELEVVPRGCDPGVVGDSTKQWCHCGQAGLHQERQGISPKELVALATLKLFTISAATLSTER
jgi:hypothetical protein